MVEAQQVRMITPIQTEKDDKRMKRINVLDEFLSLWGKEFPNFLYGSYTAQF